MTQHPKVGAMHPLHHRPLNLNKHNIGIVLCPCAQINWDAANVDAILLKLSAKHVYFYFFWGGLNVSQQATFMPQALDYGGRHHHAATKAVKDHQ